MEALARERGRAAFDRVAMSVEPSRDRSFKRVARSNNRMTAWARLVPSLSAWASICSASSGGI